MLNYAILFLFYIAIFHCFLFTISCPPPNPNLYYQPVIGILSHPGDGTSGRHSNATGASFIHASYVKFVEAAGARVVPLIYNEPEEKLLKKLELVNGVLFTGGWADTGLYLETVGKIFKEDSLSHIDVKFGGLVLAGKSFYTRDMQRLLKYELMHFGILHMKLILHLFIQKALQKNDAGDHFPLYAICLGFELISVIISEDKNILEEFKAKNQASTLQFVENASIEETVFERFPPELLKKLSTDCLVMQNHVQGISPTNFRGNKKLSSFFEILTTCNDEEDKVYVSTVRSRNYPLTGFQWHPEKNPFGWGSPRIPHTEDAIQTTQYVANFLVSEARKSLNKPVTQELFDNLIYNHSPTFYAKEGIAYDEVYIFV